MAKHYFERDAEKVRQRSREYYRRNRERVLARQRERYQRNRVQILARKKQIREGHRYPLGLSARCADCGEEDSRVLRWRVQLQLVLCLNCQHKRNTPPW